MRYNPYRRYCGSWWKFWLNVPGDVFGFIARIWDYAPLLWEDRDWDQAYLLRLMRLKIRRMRRSMEEHAIIAHAEDRVAEMAHADVLLRNVVDEDPDDEWSSHYHQWDAHIKGFKECKNRREHMRSLKLSVARANRNWRNLWRHLEKHMNGWWD